MDKEIDKTLDKVEEAAEGKDTETQNKSDRRDKQPNDTHSKSDRRDAPSKPQAPISTSVLNWSSYDFVPGDKPLFEDNLIGEKNGEFPSRWDLVKGTVEIAQIDGENVIFIRGSGNMYNGGIVPLLKNPKEDYLPDEFTIEFDAFFKAGVKKQDYYITLFDRKNQKNKDIRHIKFGYGYANYDKTTTNYKDLGQNSAPDNDTWRHISISFNTRALKVYLDEVRVLNIPNLGGNPTGITLSADAYKSTPHIHFIKNFKVAEGAVPLYSKAISEGRIVTRGIVFDVNKSIIKPESMGVINEITKLMQDNPDVRFLIEGHTDSDGSAERNMQLSDERAKAIKTKLVELGIDTSRLETAGMGPTKPIADNTSPEGKAMNRRVEFVKL
ncbi:MAG: OmpA family protein [Ignavibacteriae bacterium]|nr:OmpA family protein [Ignavibacteriota bacterium]